MGVGNTINSPHRNSAEWCNGSHEGLKIPWTEMSVRVRVPSPLPRGSPPMEVKCVRYPTNPNSKGKDSDDGSPSPIFKGLEEVSYRW